MQEEKNVRLELEFSRMCVTFLGTGLSAPVWRTLVFDDAVLVCVVHQALGCGNPNPFSRLDAGLLLCARTRVQSHAQQVGWEAHCQRVELPSLDLLETHPETPCGHNGRATLRERQEDPVLGFTPQRARWFWGIGLPFRIASNLPFSVREGVSSS